MVNKLNAGSLPARLIEQPISVKTIGPSIGEENRNQGIKAGIIGFIVVMVCVLIYYLRAGAIADVALVMNILFVLSIMAGVNATFTLPGIAGFLLSTGMAVDANILIFERMKEELRAGRTLQAAVAAGFDRAWTSIWDSQASTLIICAILYVFGSNFGASIVKGFAITLAVGTVLNLFTAITVTRTFMAVAVQLGQKSLSRKKWLLGA